MTCHCDYCRYLAAKSITTAPTIASKSLTEATAKLAAKLLK
jgi:hypothetical protein